MPPKVFAIGVREREELLKKQISEKGLSEKTKLSPPLEPMLVFAQMTGELTRDPMTL